MILHVYEDERGWQYKVMEDLAGKFCPRYHKPSSPPESGWKCCKNFDHEVERDVAEVKLGAHAREHGWVTIR